MIKPYSRAVEIENSLKIAARFCLFRRLIIASVNTVVRGSKAVVALCDFLKKGRVFNDRYCALDYTHTEREIPGQMK